MSKKAAVLLSAGCVDSTALLTIAHDGFELLTLSFAYGQRHQREIEAALAVARHYDVQTQKVIEIDLRAFGGSALTDDFDVPHARSIAKMSQKIPITYVPARRSEERRVGK